MSTPAPETPVPADLGLPPRRRRAGATALVGAVIAGAAYLAMLGLGPRPLGPAEVLEVLTGGGSPADVSVVWDLRLPVAVVTVAVGALLGVAGSWTQTAVRNPLASPDVLGVVGGASVAVVAGTVLVRPAFAADLAIFWWRFGLALAGAATIVVLLIVLAGADRGSRLVLIGVGLALLSHAVVSFLLLKAELARAADSQTWLAGSTGYVRADAILPLILTSLPFLAFGAWQARDLPVLAHDDATAVGVGVPVGRIRGRVIGAAVGLAAACVAVVGPIGFIALVAPQIARLVARAPTPPPLASGAMGAALLGGCAVVGELIPHTIPVGTITAVVGGPVLVALVVRASRRETVL